MRALTVSPGTKDSAALTDVPDPPESDGPILVETVAIGVCGTDEEILAGNYGTAPEGEDRLVIGHESLGRVVDAPVGSGFGVGDLVVGIVRRPDPVPCPHCAIGEWDMCRNGLYTERGIKERHGFASDRFRLHPEFAVHVDTSLGDLNVLTEPASVVAKAWDHIERIGARSPAWKPRSVLVVGAGPVGLLAALMGRQRELDVTVLDQVTDGPKPDLVRSIGATYEHDNVADCAPHADVILECTGVASVVVDTLSHLRDDAIVCLAGVSSGGRSVPFDAGEVNRNMVLANAVVFGSVNANRRHYTAAVEALTAADRTWLEGLVTRRVPVESFADAFDRRPDDVKTILTFTE